MFLYIYIYVCVCVCVCVLWERKRERERERLDWVIDVIPFFKYSFEEKASAFWMEVFERICLLLLSGWCKTIFLRSILFLWHYSADKSILVDTEIYVRGLLFRCINPPHSNNTHTHTHTYIHTHTLICIGSLKKISRWKNILNIFLVKL